MKKWTVVLLTLTLLLTPMTATAQSSGNVTEVTPIYMGDVNVDGVIGADDALLVLKAIVTPVPPETYLGSGYFATDVSGDGGLRAEDALLILQKVVNKIEHFPVDEALYGQNLTWRLANPEQYEKEPYASFLDKLEQQYNMTLTLVAPRDSFQADLEADTETADVVSIAPWFARDMGRQGHLANLNTNLLQNSRYRSLNGGTGFGDDTYGIGYEFGGMKGIFYNKEMLAKIAPDLDLDQLYQSGKWDFETFRALATLAIQDTDQNGKTDVYGVTATTHLIEMALAANGGMTKISDGRIVERFSESADTLDWCKALLRTDQSWLYKADIFACIDQFSKGNAFMFASYVQFGTQILENTDFAVGFIPMPKVSENNAYQTAANGLVLAVPKNKADKAAAAVVLAIQLQQLEACKQKDTQEQYRKLGLDEASAKRLAELSDIAIVDYGDGVISIFDEIYVSPPDQALWPAIAQRELNDYYAPFYD